MSGWPRSLGWFAATAIIYILQVIPLTGIFLMFAMAPLWSVFTVNAGFLSLAVEAALGKISRFWLLAPLAWFGGYAVATIMSHSAASNLDAQYRAHNATRSLPFGTRQALVFASDSDELSGAAGGFVQTFDIDVAYEANANFAMAKHLARRIGGPAVCKTIRADPSFASAGVYSFGFHERHKLINGLCAYYMPEDPNLSPVTISAKTERVAGFLLPYRRTTATIQEAGGRSIDLLAGHASPLNWLPTPVMGCALNSGAPSWDCSAGFMRSHVGLGGDGAYGGAVQQAVAAALELRRSPASERRSRIAAMPAPAFDKVIADRVNLSTATLDEVIANPAKRVTVHDLKGLFERRDLIEVRRDAIIAAAPAALSAKPPSKETARLLQDMLAILPDPSFAVAGRALLADFNTRPSLDEYDVSKTFVARLGDFGVDAVPMLEKLAFANPRNPNSGALVGLCRAGPAAASSIEKLGAQLRLMKRTTNSHSAIYVALLRLGRPDLTDADPDAASRYKAKDYAAWRATITPASPPSVCDTVKLWPRLPDSAA